MKLSVATPNNNIDGTFKYQTLAENSSEEVLKEEGFKYAESNGEDKENLCWHGNVVTGDKPVHPVEKWTMDLVNGSILIIE